MYKRIGKRYMVFTVWYCYVLYVLARWFLRKMVRKSLKKSFFQEFKKFIYIIGFFNILKLRGESSGNFKEITSKRV